jgi:hypothetical protein
MTWDRDPGEDAIAFWGTRKHDGDFYFFREIMVVSSKRVVDNSNNSYYNPAKRILKKEDQS